MVAAEDRQAGIAALGESEEWFAVGQWAEANSLAEGIAETEIMVSLGE